MYTKNKSKQIVIRVTAVQYDFLKSCSVVFGQSISDVVRGFIDSFIAFTNENANK